MHTDEASYFDEMSDADVAGMNRREFLKLAGSGIFLFFTIGDTDVLAQGAPSGGTTLPSDFNAFLKIGPDGRVSCYTGKIEMGQGAITSLAQELADELDTPLESVDMVMGDTDLCPWDMGTFGSRTTRFFGPALRAAGAEARDVLRDIAAEKFKTSRNNFVTDRGFLIDTRDKARRIPYGQLAQGRRIERHLTGNVTVKGPTEFKVMGKPAARTDGRGKVTGAARFAGDIQVPGMLYARFVRPPDHGSKFLEADLSEAKRVDGVQIIEDRDFIAVLHKHPDMAELALSKVTSRFSNPVSSLDDKTIFDHLLKVAPEGVVLAQGGDLKGGERSSASLFTHTYYNDYVSHAAMEPHTAVVKLEGNKATIWASTQTPFRAREEVANELGLPVRNVRVMPVFVGGGFGGKSMNQQIIEAARCAKACGKPVQVAWTRKEEFFYDFFRPASVVRIISGLTAQGSISLWDFHVYFAGERGAAHFYDIADHRTTVYSQSPRGVPGAHPFATGPWRAPAANTNTFARESQIDIMAAKAGHDPLEFRMRHIKDAKMLRVLRTAADKFGWKPIKGPSGRGMGLACCIDAGSYVATMAEVTVDKSTGLVRVKRVVSAQDMGLAINPEGAAIQMEGAITMGLGYALSERIRFKGGNILDHNFDTYELPKFSWLPKIETVIIDDKHAVPQGGGEPAIVTTGAVIANAVFDATGTRIFILPMTPERIREALKRA